MFAIDIDHWNNFFSEDPKYYPAYINKKLGFYLREECRNVVHVDVLEGHS